MQLDIVITYYKTPELLQCCLTKLKEFDDSRIDKIIIVDNSRVVDNKQGDIGSDEGWSLSWLPEADCNSSKIEVIPGYNSHYFSGEA